MKTGKTSASAKSLGISTSKFTNNVSYRTLEEFDGTKSTGTLCAATPRVSKKKEVEGTICPISNLPSAPSVSDDDKEELTRHNLELWRLKRDNATLRQSERALLFKLSRCLELIQSEERFFSLGMEYGQWETIGELTKRRLYLKAIRELIIDPLVTAQLDEMQEKALKERMRL